METTIALERVNVSMEAASQWLLNSLNNADMIYQTARNLSLSQENLADIASSVGLDISEADVNSYFESNNLDGSLLVGFDSEQAVESLLFMIEEEKMARDIYDVLYTQTDLRIFSNIADAEQRHMDALLDQAASLGIDTTAIEEPSSGVYINTTIQALSDSLLSIGSVSSNAAIEVGILIEETDIRDLTDSIATSTDVLLLGVYENLLSGSLNHLNAFESAL